MGEAEIIPQSNQLIIHSVIFFYGDAASDALAKEVANDIATHWNEIKGQVVINRNRYDVLFNVEGIWAKSITPEMIFVNVNPRNNYFRVEEYAEGNISFVDGLNSNTGYFKLENLLNNSTTAAHEYGHTLGLDHPEILDIRGNGRPGMMYPRGTIVDPEFQYDPLKPAGQTGGTMNPFTRKVTEQDILDLRLHKLSFNASHLAVIGGFTNNWHGKHLPPLNTGR